MKYILEKSVKTFTQDQQVSSTIYSNFYLDLVVIRTTDLSEFNDFKNSGSAVFRMKTHVFPHASLKQGHRTDERGQLATES